MIFPFPYNKTPRFFGTHPLDSDTFLFCSWVEKKQKTGHGEAWSSQPARLGSKKGFENSDFFTWRFHRFFFVALYSEGKGGIMATNPWVFWGDGKDPRSPTVVHPICLCHDGRWFVWGWWMVTEKNPRYTPENSHGTGKLVVCKCFSFFQGSIFRFHVSYWGCSLFDLLHVAEKMWQWCWCFILPVVFRCVGRIFAPTVVMWFCNKKMLIYRQWKNRELCTLNINEFDRRSARNSGFQRLRLGAPWNDVRELREKKPSLKMTEAFDRFWAWQNMIFHFTQLGSKTFYPPKINKNYNYSYSYCSSRYLDSDILNPQSFSHWRTGPVVGIGLALPYFVLQTLRREMRCLVISKRISLFVHFL